MAASPARTPYAGTETQLFLLGAAKSGTTSLSQWLDRQPSIVLSQPKEPYFFELFYERGLQDYWDHCFAPRWSGEPMVLDARHRNLYLPFVPARIEKSAPNPKFVAILREPVARARSHWWHWRSRGRERLDFAAAVADDWARIRAGIDFAGDDGPELWASNYPEAGSTYNGIETLKYRTYVDTGFYAQQLERFIARFGRDRVFVLLTDELEHDQAATLERLSDFLGVPAGDAVEAAPVENAARPALRGTPPRRASRARSLLRRVTPVGFRNVARRHLEGRHHRPDVDPTTRSFLHRVYEHRNEHLAVLLDRQLPAAWAHSAIDSSR